MDASHLQGLADVPEPLRYEHWLQSNLNSIQGNAKFVFPCIDIPQCRATKSHALGVSLTPPDDS